MVVGDLWGRTNLIGRTDDEEVDVISKCDCDSCDKCGRRTAQFVDQSN